MTAERKDKAPRQYRWIVRFMFKTILYLAWFMAAFFIGLVISDGLYTKLAGQ